MFSKFERSAQRGERGNAAVVALGVTTLAVGVVMAVRLLTGSGSSKPVMAIAATNIGAGKSDANPSGTGKTSSGPITSGSSNGTANGTANGTSIGFSTGSSSVGAVPTPVPTLPGSVPTIPPDGAGLSAAPVPVVAIEVTPTTTPPVILGLKTPQAASRNLFDAWKENDRARARRFASAAAVDVIFRQAWGAEVQDDGCSETSNPTSFHCAFVGDEIAWIVVVDQRIGPLGREFVPTRTIRTEVKSGSSLTFAPPVPEAADTGGSAASGLSPTTTIDPSLLGDAPLVDPAETADLSNPAIGDPSLLDPAGAAAALADSAAVSAADPGVGASQGGTTGASATKPSTGPTAKTPKKKKSTVRRPKSAVSSSSKSAASTDAGASAGGAEPEKPTTNAVQPAPTSSGGAAPAAPADGAVKAGAPPVNQVDG